MIDSNKYTGKYLERSPLSVLAFGGVFTIASLTNGGVFFEQSLLVFLYGITSSFVRQVYKDLIKHFLKVEKHKRYWMLHYLLQAILFSAFVTLLSRSGLFRW